MQKFIEILKKFNVLYTLKNNTLTVTGDLDLDSTNIEELPDGLTVDGNLDLYDTPIKKLPINLTVGGSLNLSCEMV